MVSRQTISSPFFATRGKLSPLMLRGLMVRGGGIHVDDTLRRFGWDGEGAVGTVVMTTNEDSGMVVGVRFETRGVGPEVTFKAKDLWQEAEAGVTVTVVFQDLARVSWKTEGVGRNQSTWIDSASLEVSYWGADGKRLESQEDLDGMEIGWFAVRLTLLPTAVSKLVLYGGIVPMSKDDLEEKVREAGL